MIKHNQEAHKRRKTRSRNSILFISLIVLVLIVLGIIFIKPILQNKQYDNYNHFEFIKSTNDKGGVFWTTNVENNGYLTPITFYNHPRDVESIPYENNITDFVLKQPHNSFVIAIDDKAGSIPVIGGINIARILGKKYYGFGVESALYLSKNKTLNTTLPVVNCNNATLLHPIIYINVDANNQSIIFDNNNKNCIILNSPSNQKEDVLPVADLFVYKILRIIN